MLQEVKECQVASFVPDTYLAALLVFVAPNNVPFEKVVPTIASLKRVRVEELNFLLLNREKEVFS